LKHKTPILSFVLYWCETCSITLREELTLRVSENRDLRKISGHKREEETGECRKLHNRELHNLNSNPDITEQIKSMRMRCAQRMWHAWEKTENSERFW
jgi:hypothetical protein